jgi:asparaginyl-tRNA synthetase
MQVVSVKKALAGSVSAGSKVEVRGWVRTRRDSKAGISFVNVSDGSAFDPIQVVAPNTLPNYEKEILHLTAGCSVVCRGTLVQSQGKGQAFEVQADEVQVLGMVDDPDTYPIQPKQHTLEFLRVRHTAAQAIHRFFHEEGFFWVNTPIITASDAEGAGQMFRVSTLDAVNPPRTQEGKIDWHKDFFGKEAYLTVSGQLNVEAYCLAMSKVYTFGPTFRAENSNTTRHLAEFWMIEPEIAFADLNDDANLAEQFLKYVFKAVLTECGPDMKFFEERVQKGVTERLEKFINSSFERIHYTDAIEILKKAKKKFEYQPECRCLGHGSPERARRHRR